MPDIIDRLFWFCNQNAMESIKGHFPSDKAPHGNSRLGFMPNSYQGYRAPSGGAARLNEPHTIVCSVSVVLSCDSVYGALAGTRQCGGFSGRIRDYVVKFRDGMQSRRHDPPVSREP
jgi:hypothetical protein